MGGAVSLFVPMNRYGFDVVVTLSVDGIVSGILMAEGVELGSEMDPAERVGKPIWLWAKNESHAAELRSAIGETMMTRQCQTIGPILDTSDRPWMVFLYPVMFDASQASSSRVLMGLRQSNCNAKLSPREVEVACLISKDMTSSEIGRSMGLRKSTVDTFRGRILRKLGVSGAAGITRWCIREGLVRAE